MRKQHRKRVHFNFQAHPSGEKHLPANRKVLVLENATGIAPEKRTTKQMLEGIESTSPIRDSYKRVGLRALSEGRAVHFGETGTLREIEKIHRLELRDAQNNRAMFDSPTLTNIKKYFIDFAEREKYRHLLIVKTVKEASKKGKVDARYGALHSLLIKELQQEKVFTSRSIKPQVFSWDQIVLRKLILGQKVSVSEYLKGYFSAVSFSLFLPKDAAKHKENDNRFAALATNELLKNLEQKTLEEVMRTGHFWLLFEPNNLPNLFDPKYSYEQRKKIMIKFLDDRSEFWKRLPKMEKDSLVRGNSAA